MAAIVYDYPEIFRRHADELLSSPDFRWGLPGLTYNAIPLALLDAIDVAEAGEPHFEARYNQARQAYSRGRSIPPIVVAIPPDGDGSDLELRRGGPILLAARELGVPEVYTDLCYDSFQTALTPRWSVLWDHYYSQPPDPFAALALALAA